MLAAREAASAAMAGGLSPSDVTKSARDAAARHAAEGAASPAATPAAVPAGEAAPLSHFTEEELTQELVRRCADTAAAVSAAASEAATAAAAADGATHKGLKLSQMKLGRRATAVGGLVAELEKAVAKLSSATSKAELRRDRLHQARARSNAAIAIGALQASAKKLCETLHCCRAKSDLLAARRVSLDGWGTRTTPGSAIKGISLAAAASEAAVLVEDFTALESYVRGAVDLVHKEAPWKPAPKRSDSSAEKQADSDSASDQAAEASPGSEQADSDSASDQAAEASPGSDSADSDSGSEADASSSNEEKSASSGSESESVDDSAFVRKAKGKRGGKRGRSSVSKGSRPKGTPGSRQAKRQKQAQASRSTAGRGGRSASSRKRSRLVHGRSAAHTATRLFAQHGQ